MNKYVKRILDLTLSLSALIFLSPIFIVVMLILRFSAEGEIFYLQERLGLYNKKFYIIKFATMLKNSMNMGSGSITLKNDTRVTKIGFFLRKSKINELPQLINILKGDISIVGPRPLVKSTFDAYPDNIKKNIYAVKPGLTGIGSIVFRDEESIISRYSHLEPHVFYKNKIAPYKGELEIWYQNNYSFLLDLKLIFFTAFVIIFPKSNLYKIFFKGLPKNPF